MKTFVYALLCCFFLTNCKAQDSDFNSYLGNFGNTNLPLVIRDRQSYHSVFNQRYDSILHETYKEIPEGLAAKYICTKGFCNPDAGLFSYSYGVKIDYGQDFLIVLVNKFRYEGDTEWNFDLGEILLITYNNKGEILSRLSLTKDNDRWKSSLKITKQGITVRQIKITEPKIDQYHRDLHCEYWTTTYQITTDGIIKPIETSPVSTGIVIWDKSNEEYFLAE